MARTKQTAKIARYKKALPNKKARIQPGSEREALLRSHYTLLGNTRELARAIETRRRQDDDGITALIGRIKANDVDPWCALPSKQRLLHLAPEDFRKQEEALAEIKKDIGACVETLQAEIDRSAGQMQETIRVIETNIKNLAETMDGTASCDPKQ